jgi:hypothetical protein
MPRWPSLEPDYDEALRALARLEVSYAEAWRRLIPIENRLRIGRPTYWKVRRFIQLERRELELRRRRNRQIAEDLLADVMRGLCPIQRYF